MYCTTQHHRSLHFDYTRKLSLMSMDEQREGTCTFNQEVAAALILCAIKFVRFGFVSAKNYLYISTHVHTQSLSWWTREMVLPVHAQRLRPLSKLRVHSE